MVASAETLSEHPLAAAIVEGARAGGFALSEPGGASNRSLGKASPRPSRAGRWRSGNTRLLLRRLGIDPEGLLVPSERLAAEGKTPMLVAVDGRAVGVVAVADTIKEGSAAAVAALARAASTWS